MHKDFMAECSVESLFGRVLSGVLYEIFMHKALNWYILYTLCQNRIIAWRLTQHTEPTNDILYTLCQNRIIAWRLTQHTELEHRQQQGERYKCR